MWKMQIGVAHGQLRTAERRRLSIAGTTSTDINGIGDTNDNVNINVRLCTGSCTRGGSVRLCAAL